MTILSTLHYLTGPALPFVSAALVGAAAFGWGWFEGHAVGRRTGFSALLRENAAQQMRMKDGRFVSRRK